MKTAYNVYKHAAAMAFLLRFKQEFIERDMEYSTSKDHRELMFKWNGADMKLTVMENGYIMASEKQAQGKFTYYDMTSINALELGAKIAEFRLNTGR